ncbi:CRISPR-associated protein Csx19 [Streptosporangium sp. NBC_01495]|uniref:type III-D CRISPR-associated protein Csx19 n=1 Tax=Streptosporangium sp. NBC_01495 TaxID=2903899 RepID=UPI002E305192|nr:CRISPR-associated protein Csx19 [Streptosporangium sp. NBC_01495]
MTVLYGAATTGVTLADALEAADVAGGCALLTAPSAYHVARAEGRGCVTSAGPVDLSTVYEARVFTSEVELRWVEAGYAVVLTEDESLLPASFGDPLDALPAETTMEARYLVWGKVIAPTLEPAPGWVTLRSARIGAVTVPMTTPAPQDRVRLTAREYVVADRVHGNAYVAEERLIGFEPYATETCAAEEVA